MYNIIYLIIIISSLNVIFASNPIHAMLFLVSLFISMAMLWFNLGLDYLALMLLIVYVGAINILFLFIIMMLNIKITISKFHFFKFIPIASIFIILFFFLIYNFDFNIYDLYKNFNSLNKYDINLIFNNNILNWNDIYINKTNIDNIGYMLINDYLSLLIISGLILLLAMISAIILTFQKTNKNKKQIIIKQLKHKGILWLYK